MMVITSGGAHPSGIPDCIPDFSGVRIAKTLVFERNTYCIWRVVPVNWGFDNAVLLVDA